MQRFTKRQMVGAIVFLCIFILSAIEWGDAIGSSGIQSQNSAGNGAVIKENNAFSALAGKLSE